MGLPHKLKEKAMTKLKVGMISLGCNKNRVDSETALGLLREHGYELTNDPAQADVLMVNTCGFIASAKEESIDAILDMARYKQIGKCRVLVVTGCLAQRYREEIQQALKHATYAPLYPKHKRDAIISHGILHGTALEKINEKLAQEQEQPLF